MRRREMVLGAVLLALMLAATAWAGSPITDVTVGRRAR